MYIVENITKQRKGKTFITVKVGGKKFKLKRKVETSDEFISENIAYITLDADRKSWEAKHLLFAKKGEVIIDSTEIIEDSSNEIPPSTLPVDENEDLLNTESDKIEIPDNEEILPIKDNESFIEGHIVKETEEVIVPEKEEADPVVEDRRRDELMKKTHSDLDIMLIVKKISFNKKITKKEKIDLLLV